MNRMASLITRAHARWLATPLVFGLLATVASAQDKRWGPNPSASTYGYRFDDLFALVTALCGVSFIIVILLLMVPCLRDRASKGAKATFDHGTSLKDKRLTASVSVAVFLILDAWVLIVAMHDLREGYWNIPAAGDERYEDAVKVEVLGQQWAWNFRTPGVDGEFGTADDIITINELTLPKDRAAIFNMTSKDVIHSLYIPDMRMKRDLNPGAINAAWFEPTKAGEYDILCAELCGYAHYQMFGKLDVLEEADYDAWEAEASKLATLAYDENDTEARWAWTWRE